MEKLKWTWKKQDIFNKLIFLSGIALAIYGITQGGGFYSIVIVALMTALCAVRALNTSKTRSRFYGGLFFHMPDGETFPVDFEKVRQEFVHGQGNYLDRPVTVELPYGVINPEGRMDSLFGLEIDFSDYADPEKILPTLKRDQLISVTGELVAQGHQFFYLGRVSDVHRAEKKNIMGR